MLATEHEIRLSKAELHDVVKACHLGAGVGFSWQQIIQWVIAYGLPLVIQFLTLVVPLIAGGKMTLAMAAEYALVWFPAAFGGGTPPPPPENPPPPPLPPPVEPEPTTEPEPAPTESTETAPDSEPASDSV